MHGEPFQVSYNSGSQPLPRGNNVNLRVCEKIGKKSFFSYTHFFLWVFYLDPSLNFAFVLQNVE